MSFIWRYNKATSKTSENVCTMKFVGDIISGIAWINNKVYGSYENPLSSYTFQNRSEEICGKIFCDDYYEIIATASVTNKGSMIYQRYYNEYLGGVTPENNVEDTRNGYGNLIGYDTDNTTITQITGASSPSYTEYANTTIKGKYKAPSSWNYNIITSWSIPLKFTVYNKRGEFVSNADFIGVLGSVENQNSTMTGGLRYWDSTKIQSVDDIDSVYRSISAEYTIDFGDTPQNIPSFLKTFINNSFTYLYPNNYDIYSNDGSVKYGEFEYLPNVKTASLSLYGNRKYLTITDINNVNHTIEWDSIAPENTTFLGLSYGPNADRPNITLGVNNVTWDYSLSVFEVYGKYKPPQTTIDIYLYKNSAEPNRVDKTNYLEQVGLLKGAFRDEPSITNPIITIQQTEVPQFNYVYIPIFNRYYYVTDITSFRQTLWEISLSIDVLMSYKDAIKSCYAFVDRNEFEFSEYVIDSKRVIEQGYDIEQSTISNELFDKGLQGDSFVLNGFALKSYTKG